MSKIVALILSLAILVLTPKDNIEVKDLPIHLFSKTNNTLESASSTSLDDIQKNAIMNAIKTANGNKSKAARILNIPRHVLLYKLKKYDIQD